MKILILIILFIVTTAIISLLYMWYRLHKAMSMPSDPINVTPSKHKLKYQIRHFKTADGVSLKGWYIPVKSPKAVVIVIHGYVDTKATIVDHTKYLHDGGYTTFFIDLRSDDKKTKYTMGVKEWQDVEAAYEYMKSLPENKDKKIGFFSASMGAATSIVAAGKSGKGDFVIAAVPYANFERLFEQQLRNEKLPLFLLPFLRIAAILEFGLRYHTIAPSNYITRISNPVFLMSAKHDEIVNANDAKQLFDSANSPKHFWEADAHHRIFDEIPDEFASQVLKFLNSL